MNSSFQQWIAFTFGLGAGPSMLRFEPYPGSFDEMLKNCNEFFESGGADARALPRENVIQSLAMLPGIDGQLGILAMPSLPISARFQLVDSQVALFRQLFSADFADASFMWWEWLAGAQIRDFPAVGEDRRLCEHIFAVITRILTIPSEKCQLSALHGLHEFAGFASKIDALPGIVHAFLRDSPSLTEPVRRYAWRVIGGDVQ